MKVAQFCSALNGTYVAVASMLTLAQGLRDLGHTVEFVGFRGRGLGEVVEPLGFACHEVSVRFKLDPVAAVSLSWLLKRGDFDVIHSHLSTSCLIGGWAGQRVKVPSVATVHGLSRKWSFLTNRRLVAVSAEVKRHLVAQGVASSRVSIVHNGVEVGPTPSKGAREEARRNLGLEAGRPVVGTTARLTEAKGIHHALSAFAHVQHRHRSAKLVVFGDGPERARLGELAVALGVEKNVVFAGYRADVRELLPALDAFVFPTLKEAMGIAVVEAMLAGVPVVAHRVGWVPEVVKEGTGYLVDVGDEDSLARRVADLLYDEDLRGRMGSAAREWAATEFDARRMADRKSVV